jgi:FixJ family two-component response regulator
MLITNLCRMHITYLCRGWTRHRNVFSRRLPNIMIGTGARSMHAGAAEIAWHNRAAGNSNTMPIVLRRFNMGPTNEMVYIVDDDATIGESLSSLLRANGKRVRTFTSGQEFLDFGRQDDCACLILDLRMPGLNGLEVQRSISAKAGIPVIFITGRGDIPSTVTAMKGGAIDFLKKPVDEAALLGSIERALELDRRRREKAFEYANLLARYQSLTPREQQVLPLLVKGLLNKQAAGELGITEYTVQIHRGHIMRKMEADSFATLVKLASKLNLEPTNVS